MGHNIPGLKTFLVPSGENCNQIVTLGRMRKLTDRQLGTEGQQRHTPGNLNSQGRLPGGDASQMNPGERQSYTFPRRGRSSAGAQARV